MGLRTHDTPSIPATALSERPLASLPPAQAAAFVAALMAPGQRFARAFHHHYRLVRGEAHGVATASTLAALAGAARSLLSELGEVHTLGGQDPGYRPVALYALRELTETPWAPCAGPFALVHSIGLLDEHAHLDIVKALWLAIVERALAREQRRLFVLCADDCLQEVLTHLGVEFRSELVAPDALHRVGNFDLESLDNLERIYQLGYGLGRVPAGARRAA